MSEKELNPLTELSEEVAVCTIVKNEVINNDGVQPQCSATTDSNCSTHNNNNSVLNKS